MVLCERDREELTRVLQHNEHPVWRADSRIEKCFESIAFAVDESASNLEESLLRLRRVDTSLGASQVEDLLGRIDYGV
jgi:hypothetical protein